MSVSNTVSHGQEKREREEKGMQQPNMKLKTSEMNFRSVYGIYIFPYLYEIPWDIMSKNIVVKVDRALISVVCVCAGGKLTKASVLQKT